LERELLSLVQSDLVSVDSGSAASGTSQGDLGGRSTVGDSSTGAIGPSTLFTADRDAEAEYFGAPEAVAIRPHLKWAHTALVLFDLLDMLLQHNVNALVHDALCFYAVHQAEVNAGLSSGIVEARTGALPFAQMTRTPPEVLELSDFSGQSGSPEESETTAPIGQTMPSSPARASSSGSGRPFPDLPVVDPWRSRFWRLMHSRLLSTASGSMQTSFSTLIALCKHPYPAIVSSAYKHLFNMFQEQLYVVSALERCTLQSEWAGDETAVNNGAGRGFSTGSSPEVDGQSKYGVAGVSSTMSLGPEAVVVDLDRPIGTDSQDASFGIQLFEQYDVAPIPLTLDLVKSGQRFVVAATQVVREQGEVSFERLLHLYYRNLVLHLSPIKRALEGSLFSSLGSTDWDTHPAAVGGPQGPEEAKYLLDILSHLARVTATPDEAGHGEPVGDTASISPDLAVKLVHLVRCVIRHVLLQDLFDGKVSLEDETARDVPVIEDNLHLLYRRLLMRVVTNTTLARFQSLDDEDLQEKLSASVALRLRDLLVSNGAGHLVSVLLSYALRVVHGEGSEGTDTTGAPGVAPLGSGGDDEDDTWDRDQQRQVGLRLLGEVSQLGRWLAYDANTPVQEALVLSLVQGQAHGQKRGHGDKGASRVAGGEEDVSRSRVLPGAGSDGQDLLVDLRKLVAHTSRIVAIRRTLFSERPEIMSMFSQSAKAISARGADGGDAALTAGPSPEEQRQMQMIQLQQMIEAGEDVSATVALVDSDDDNNVMDDEVSSG
jgi:hypothetical protein